MTAQPERRRGPNASRSGETRGKIIAAAIRCLADYGYAETSTVRVAQMAPVARGSLLHQFPTRVDMILEVASYAARAQGAFIRTRLAKLPTGRERFVGSVEVTWEAFQRPESKALLEIMIAAPHDPELAARIPDFAQRFEAGVARGARYFAEEAGLNDEQGEATASLRLMLAALRGLSIETRLGAPTTEPDAVIARLKRMRAEFYDAHR